MNIEFDKNDDADNESDSKSESSRAWYDNKSSIIGLFVLLVF